MRSSAVVLAVLLAVGAQLPQPDVDWKVWGGPDRNFIARSAGLFAGTPEKWISTPPKRLWERPLGDGYSAIAVEGDRLYTGFRRGSSDVFVAIDAATGKSLWEFNYPAPFTNAFASDVGPGPYAMPQVVGDRIVTASGIGQIHSIDKTDRSVGVVARSVQAVWWQPSRLRLLVACAAVQGLLDRARRWERQRRACVFARRTARRSGARRASRARTPHPS